MHTSEATLTDRIRGCLLGGAVGDALGAPVEFMSTAGIREVFGAQGIREFSPAYGRLGAVTDDTQMTLFTAEGVLRAVARHQDRGICHPPAVIHHALIRWLHTQGETSQVSHFKPDGWLIQDKRLFARRGPGNTCLTALKAAESYGRSAVNDSKGCGSIMRIAPVALVVEGCATTESSPRPQIYENACESAQSTHGHPFSTVASGYFALVIAHLLHGASLHEAIEQSKAPLLTEPDSLGVLFAIASAERLAQSGALSTPEAVETLGGGWVAEEALSIALFCALRAKSYEQGVRLAVNHSGDSDSTGSLTGQILGTLLGAQAIPARWVAQVELRDIIEILTTDIACVHERGRVDSHKYPGA